MNLIDDRSRDIFRLIVEEYLKSGIPIGSRTISKGLAHSLSPATIRNVMADLENSALLFSPHTSAGRQPTERGLRLYVDTLMKVDDITSQRQEIERQLSPHAKSLSQIYDGASTLLSGLSSCIGVVIAPKMNQPILKVEFLKLEPRKVLAILITQDSTVENRIIQMSYDVSTSELEQARNFINDRLYGKTLIEVKDALSLEIIKDKTKLTSLTQLLVEEGIVHPLSSLDDGHIFVSGQSKLLDDTEAQQRLDDMKTLFAMLEEKQSMLSMMGAVEQGEGVQIFIGTENPIFEKPSWSTIIRAYHDQNGRIIGATGVIGPTRLNYGKIVPIVDYTALVVEKLLAAPPPY
jgi:heat-inducible transcriptional repressor